MNRHYLTSSVVLTLLVLAAFPALAEVRLPHLFSDGMVLQRDKPIPVWGWAEPGEAVTVKIAEREARAVAGQDGRWEVRLRPLRAGGPYDLTITGKTRRVIHEVLVGEVWVCAGQSNMEKPIGLHPGQEPCPNYQQEIAAADYPLMRLLEVPPKKAETPQTDANCYWLTCTPKNIQVQRGGGHGFSAAAYFFGRELFKELNVPIGLIAASYSGSKCEPWTPGTTERPLMYNGMISPIEPFAIRGVIWYQGESNVGDGMKYRDKMNALITGWRKAWGQGDFPFYYVQLPPAHYGKDPLSLPDTWEAQIATLKLPNTGMAITMDVGSYPECHAPNKQAVGQRLALWALAKVYGRKDLVCSGPLYKSMRVEGSSLRLRFNHTGSGLVARDGDSAALSCFEIAGDDRKFVKAEARIDGQSVVVSSSSVAHPVAVRFAWNEAAQPNLMNKEGLPAAPFRTDSWSR